VFAFSLLFGLAGLYVVIRDRGRSFAPSEAIAEAAPGIAVLPFETSGPDLDVWREGVVDLVATNIDGVAGLRAIDSRTVLARWGERVTEGATADLETSLDVARRAGAHYAVLGNASALGAAVRLTADIYAVQDGRSLGHAMVEGSPDSVYMLIDRLSIEVLRAVLGGKAEDLPRVDLARVTTTSLPALRAYLAGEVLYRRADFAAAIPEYQRAVEADSTFALANYRLAQSYGWSQNIGTEPGRQADERAARFADRLPEREAIVVRADYALVRGSLEGLEPLRKGVVKYPDDPELWYLLADTYNHLGQRALVSYEEEARTWERLLALSPDFAPYYIHPIENAAWKDDSARFAELLPRYLRLAPEGTFARRFTLLRDLLWGTPDEARMARAVVDTADGRVARGVANWLWAPRMLPLDAELYAALRRRSDANVGVATSIHWNAMARGKVAEAITILDDPLLSPSFRVSRLQGIHSLGFTVEPARMERALAEMYADTAAGPYAFLAAGAWGVDRGRAEEVDRARSRLREVSARYLAAGDSFRAGSVNGTIAGLDGYVAWKGGRRDEALALFERARREIVGLGGLSVSGDIVRWWTGELLVEMDRPKDAAQYFETFDPPDPFRAIRLGGIYEKLGERDKAREEYEEVLAVLVDPDPELRPMVAQAREGIGRLGFRPRG
jgi:tetratricopeptide (TPR) repeat protein